MSSGQQRKVPAPVWFVVAEVMLVALIPVLAIVGADALLNTRAGQFVEQPGPSDPGWEVLVDASPISLVVEVVADPDVGEVVGGVALIAQPGDSAEGGGVILLPGETLINQIPISAMRPDEVAEVISETFRLSIPTVHIVDVARWAELLAGNEIQIENPDPIPTFEGEPEIPIGVVDLDAEALSIALGRVAEDAPAGSIVVRREAIWTELVESLPPTLGESGDTLALLLVTVGAGTHDVVSAPLDQVFNGLTPNADGIEDLVNEFVPFPAGHEPGARNQVRVLDRSGAGGISEAAVVVGSMGFEVVSIGNADVFDDGDPELEVPIGVDLDRFATLIDHFGADTVEVDDSLGELGEATLLINEG